MLELNSYYEWPLNYSSIYFHVTGELENGIVRIEWCDGNTDTMWRFSDDELDVPEVTEDVFLLSKIK